MSNNAAAHGAPFRSVDQARALGGSGPLDERPRFFARETAMMVAERLITRMIKRRVLVFFDTKLVAVQCAPIEVF